MAFQSSLGIESNRKVKMFLTILIIMVISVFFIYTNSTRPNKKSIDGVYRNVCCADIVIEDGYISQGGTNLKIKLLNMKFGLTGYVDGQFTNQGLRASRTPTAIVFSTEKGNRALFLTMDRKDYTFRVMDGLEAKVR